MDATVLTALVAGGVALSTAIGTIWSSIRNAERTASNARAIEQLKIENDRLKSATEDQKRVSKFSEPLARAAYDLQSRLYNIVRGRLIESYLIKGNERERDYVIQNTTFLVAQYACWTELVRREIQFIDLGENLKTRQLLHLQDDVFGIWGSDAPSPSFRMFAGELRALGEVLCQLRDKEMTCMGYGSFLAAFPPGLNSLVDALRQDVFALEEGMDSSSDRLKAIQHALIELLALLDPQHLRFPLRRRSKA